MRIRRCACLAAALAGALTAGGCNNRSCPTETTVPPELQAMLPQSIALHPFTDTRAYTAGDGVSGIEVRLQAFDHFGDATKAFGEFRFELYAYRPHEAEPRGRRLATWRTPLRDLNENLRYWKSLTRMYEFPLALDEPIPVGERFVLAAVLESPYAPRLFAQRVFTSGQ